MKELLLTLLLLAVTTAKLCGPGGARAVIAENLLLKQQLIVLRRARQRAPNLTLSDRLICGLVAFPQPGTHPKVRHRRTSLDAPGVCRPGDFESVTWINGTGGSRDCDAGGSSVGGYGDGGPGRID